MLELLKKGYSGSNSVSPGKGLGLFIVKSILDAHKADVSVKSKEGRGTRVRVLFGPGALTQVPKEDSADSH